MKTISIVNHKGGVAKTTTAINLSKALTLKGYKVAVIDIDPQCNLTDTIATRTTGNIFDCLSSEIPLQIVNNGGLDVVCSSPYLATIHPAPDSIKKIIEANLSDYDFVIIDCPPSLGNLTISGLIASSGVIATLTPEVLPYNAIPALEGIINSVKEMGYNTNLMGLLITRYNGRTINKFIETKLREGYGDLVFNTRIRENIAIAEAPLAYQTIFEYAPKSNGAKDYLSLAEEVIKRA